MGDQVWGSGVYSGRSNLCIAARHEKQSGVVTIVGMAGRDYYLGAYYNGVSTHTSGAFSTSYRFVPSLGGCSTNAIWIVPGQQMKIDCYNCGTSGDVWGSGIYTSDSDICTAAAHAGMLGVGVPGLVGTESDLVTIVGLQGQSSYSGSWQNSVETKSWSKHHPRSFKFI